MNTARDFTHRLQDLLRRERLALADFLVALAEFDEARLWVELGHTSLFYFLHRELGLSKGAAHYRKTAAELVQGFPEIVEPLRDGRLCLTTVVEVANVLTPENRAEVLPRFFGLSKREAQEVAAELRPCEAPPRSGLTLPRSPSSFHRPLIAVSRFIWPTSRRPSFPSRCARRRALRPASRSRRSRRRRAACTSPSRARS
jgi:hypothetical protein